MNREQYIKITDFFRHPGWRSHLLFFLCRFIPVLIANLYGLWCVLFLFINPQLLTRIIGVPLACFLLVSLARIIVHRKRPYEALEFSPIKFDDKLKSGKSFPSRHTASASVIAMAFLAYLPWLGIVMLIMAALVALSRVLSGMHYISDVAAGLIFGIIVGLIGFYPLIF
ncbi:MAG: phosphatase PAP2 family protein [Clostridiales bacterium]|nr:phosphatase PAP2 family protein [Clostridiales bacterium]